MAINMFSDLVRKGQLKHKEPDAAPGWPTYIHRALHQMDVLNMVSPHDDAVRLAESVCKTYQHLVPSRLAIAYNQNQRMAKIHSA